MSFSESETQEFKAEAFELLDTGERSLLAMASEADFHQLFDSVSRVLHNLKGGAGMMNFSDLEKHVHELETILMGFKTASMIPANFIRFFLKGIDACRSMLNGEVVQFSYTVEEDQTPTESSPKPAIEAPIVENKPSEPEPQKNLIDPTLQEFVGECEDIIDRVSTALQLIESKKHDKSVVDALYRDIHSFKGASYLLSYNSLGDIAHAMESSLESVRNETRLPSPELISTHFKCLKALESGIEAAKRGVTLPELEPIGLELVKALTSVASKLPENPSTSKSIEAKSALDSALHNVIEKDPEGGGSIRVAVSLLDNLMALTGEMVLVRNQVLQFSNKSEDLEFLNLSKRLNAVTSEIQDEMMKTRMQPIGYILSKFNRVTRDLSHELGKSIVLTVEGSETELDKSLLEAIKDPLTHIIRNACDHGIELPTVRKLAGKPETGKIHVRAYHEGGQVIIEISDDGRGLNREQIKKKGIEKGLITAALADQLAEKEIFDLIFAPGFSTAAAVTNLSGRGVGMDVVRTNIERIGGAVDLSSTAGKGTNLKLKIPLTLAIVPALVVQCGKSTFAIPQVNLMELVRVDHSSTDKKIEYLQGVPVYRLRGDILPLVDLSQILKLTSQGSHDSKEMAENKEPILNIVVVKADQKSFGLIVQEIRDTADIVVKPLNRLLKSLLVYSGATIMGDGSVALILDVLGISKMAEFSLEKRSSEIQDEIRLAQKVTNQETQDYLLFKLSSPTKHAVVLNYVHRLEELPVSKIEFSGSQRVIRYGNVILPLISLNELLGYPRNSALDNPNYNTSIIVVRRGDNMYGLEVNEIIDTLSTPVEVDSTLAKTTGIFGNLNTEQELIVVINPYDLISQAIPTPQEQAQPQVKVLPSQVALVSSNLLASELIQAKRPTGPARILVVEDTLFFRNAITRLLEKTGYHVTTASDGKEALDILNQNENKFDLIVSDIEMPRVNGFALARAVRANAAYAAVPLLAVSSRADRKYLDEASVAGFNIYLEKLKPALLLESVSNLLNLKEKAA